MKVKITDATFDADHPNPEHVKGVVYSPRERCAYVETERAEIGDCIVRNVDGVLSVERAR